MTIFSNQEYKQLLNFNSKISICLQFMWATVNMYSNILPWPSSRWLLDFCLLMTYDTGDDIMCGIYRCMLRLGHRVCSRTDLVWLWNVTKGLISERKQHWNSRELRKDKNRGHIKGRENAGKSRARALITLCNCTSVRFWNS